MEDIIIEYKHDGMSKLEVSGIFRIPLPLQFSVSANFVHSRFWAPAMSANVATQEGEHEYNVLRRKSRFTLELNTAKNTQ